MKIATVNLTRTNQDKYGDHKKMQALVWATYTVAIEDVLDQALTVIFKDLKKINGFIFASREMSNATLDIEGILVAINGNAITFSSNGPENPIDPLNIFDIIVIGE